MLWTFASSGRTVLLLLLFIWLVVPWLSFSTLESILANQSAGLPLGFLFLSGDEIPITSPTIAFLETLVRYSRTFPSTIDLDDNNNWIPLLDQKSHRLNSFSYFRSLDLPPSESVLPFDESDALPDFDGLERQRRIRSEPGWNVAHINTGDDELLHIYRASLLEQQDDEDEDGYNERYDDIDMNYDCIRPGWTYRSYPVCNAFHEITLERTTGSSSSTDTTGTATERGRPTTGHRRDSSTSSIEYLGAGYFRDSWLLDWNQKIKISGTTIRDNNKAVLKHLRYEREQNADSWTKVHTEAVIMEATTSSLVTTNIYGHCATSLLVEAANEITNDIVPYIPSLQPSRGRISNEKLLELEKIRGGQPYPMNNFTTLEKLNIAIQMAAGLAEMHGMMGGVVVNNDAHPDQWLITNDNSVILNDMNNAAFLEWNFDEEDYCYYESWFDGDFRAPEQYVVNGTEVNERCVLMHNSRQKPISISPVTNFVF